jgi:hypothetical protein
VRECEREGGSGEREWSWALFEALRPPERPRAREHNTKCMQAKGEGPHDGLRETRARHALAGHHVRTIADMRERRKKSPRIQPSTGACWCQRSQQSQGIQQRADKHNSHGNALPRFVGLITDFRKRLDPVPASGDSEATGSSAS